MIGLCAKSSGTRRLAGLVFLVAMQWTAAWAATPISSCAVIARSGEYILTQDLQCSNDGIEIVADHVKLNLNDHNLTGIGRGNGIALGDQGIRTVTDVSIVGRSTISNFYAGIALLGAQNSSIKDVTVTGNYHGILLQNLRSTLPSSNTLENNTATSNLDDGFSLKEAQQNILRGNTSTRNHYGFVLDENSHGNQLLDNVASDNRYGIYTFNSAFANLIRHNTALNNPDRDLVDENFECGNTWEDNTFHTANKSCIH